MSIDFRKYIDIISGVIGGVGVRQRDLIMRLFSGNVLLSPSSIYEFGSADEVGAFFGLESAEYKRALRYFGYIAPNISKAKKISFARFTPAGVKPAVYGGTNAKVIAALKMIVAGVLNITIDGAANNIAGINFASAVTLADIASILQTAIRTSSNPQLATAVVTYDVTTRRFIITGAVIEEATITVTQSGAGLTDVGMLLELYQSYGALNVDGIGPEVAFNALFRTTMISNNFSSIVFMDTLSLADHLQNASWVHEQNIRYMYLVPCVAADYATWCAALIGFSGTGVTLVDAVNVDYDEMVPGIIMAATNYSRRKSVQSYMYRQFAAMKSKVTDTTLSNTYDAVRLNYYGETATAGQKIAFYQRGTMMGQGTSPTDMNVFANEIWLKDYAGTQIMSLQLNLGNLSANETGRAQVLNILQPVIDDALFNGAISVGKELNQTQKLVITEQTGDENAWQAIQNIGWLLDAVVSSYVTQSGATEYQIEYQLIYSKDDSVRKVNGVHQLV